MKGFTHYKRIIGSAAVALTCFTAPALAWDGTVTGTVAEIHVGTDSLGLRLTLTGVTSMCVGGPNWGYLNEADSHYKTFSALIMMARAMNTSITIFSHAESGGKCRIGYLALTPP
jgi:hypothetical protein